MAKSLLKGALVGGLTLFVWGMISWMVLPWHNMTLFSFDNENAVSNVLNTNTPQSGVYILPNPHRHHPNATPEEIAAKQKKDEKAWKIGPTAFVVMNKKGMGPMGPLMFISLLIQIAGAFLITWIFLKAGITDKVTRLQIVGAIALFAGVVCHLPYWNWWGFAVGYTLVSMLDLMVGWLLAGFAISKTV